MTCSHTLSCEQLGNRRAYWRRIKTMLHTLTGYWFNQEPSVPWIFYWCTQLWVLRQNRFLFSYFDRQKSHCYVSEKKYFKRYRLRRQRWTSVQSEVRRSDYYRYRPFQNVSFQRPWRCARDVNNTLFLNLMTCFSRHGTTRRMWFIRTQRIWQKHPWYFINCTNRLDAVNSKTRWFKGGV